MAVKLLANQVFPPVGSAILVSTKANEIWENGSPTGRIDGIRCDCRALPDFAVVSVKVLGARAPMSNEELERLASEGKITWVEFDNFSGTQWLDRKSGQLKVSATATAVRLTTAPDADSLIDFD